MCFVNFTFEWLFGRRQTIIGIKYENRDFVAAVHPYWTVLSIYQQTSN